MMSELVVGSAWICPPVEGWLLLVLLLPAPAPRAVPEPRPAELLLVPLPSIDVLVMPVVVLGVDEPPSVHLRAGEVLWWPAVHDVDNRRSRRAPRHPVGESLLVESLQNRLASECERVLPHERGQVAAEEGEAPGEKSFGCAYAAVALLAEAALPFVEHEGRVV